jgi:hypothetical protein
MNCDLTIQNFPNTLKLSIKSSCLWAVVWQSNSCFIPNWSLSGMWTKLGTTYKWDFLKDFWFHEEYNKQKVRAYVKHEKKTLSVTIILFRRAHGCIEVGLCNFFFVDFRDFIFEIFMDKKFTIFIKGSYREITFKNSNVISMSFIQFWEGGSLEEVGHWWILKVLPSIGKLLGNHHSLPSNQPPGPTKVTNVTGMTMLVPRLMALQKPIPYESHLSCSPPPHPLYNAIEKSY